MAHETQTNKLPQVLKVHFFVIQVCNASISHPYLEPPAPIHIVTGSAGSDEGLDPFLPGGHPWSAFRADDYGFTRMHIINSTMITVEQVSVDQVCTHSCVLVKILHLYLFYTSKQFFPSITIEIEAF